MKVLERRLFWIFTVSFKKEVIYDTIKYIIQGILDFQDNNEKSSDQETDFSTGDEFEYSDEMKQDTEVEGESGNDSDSDNVYLESIDILREVVPRQLKFKFLTKLNDRGNIRCYILIHRVNFISNRLLRRSYLWGRWDNKKIWLRLWKKCM